MRNRIVSLAVMVFAFAAADVRADQTIVFFRHGEKPSGGYGQITCQGYNRAVALPGVVLAKLGRLKYLYAPNPAVKISDSAGSFYYVRPLATIEPTAAKFGMPVNTKYGYNDIASLQATLITPTKDNSVIFVAWEHLMAQKLVQKIMNLYGSGVAVPAWSSTDYDSLYVVGVQYGATATIARFHHQHEGLNGQSTVCPY